MKSLRLVFLLSFAGLLHGMTNKELNKKIQNLTNEEVLQLARSLPSHRVNIFRDGKLISVQEGIKMMEKCVDHRLHDKEQVRTWHEAFLNNVMKWFTEQSPDMLFDAKCLEDEKDGVLLFAPFTYLCDKDQKYQQEHTDLEAIIRRAQQK